MRYIKTFETLTKNKWELLLSNRDKMINGKRLIDLVSTAYRKTSMGSFIKTVRDVLNTHWNVIDWGDNPDINACIFFRYPRVGESWIGRKIQGVGHDGQGRSKVYVIEQMVNMLDEVGTWIEASEKMEETLLGRGCKRVTDIELLKKLFPMSEIELLDSGQYKRTLDERIITESVFGKPKIK